MENSDQGVLGIEKRSSVGFCQREGNGEDVATAEFAEKGLSGARIDGIAAAARAGKRMIYYHLGSKEGLICRA